MSSVNTLFFFLMIRRPPRSPPFPSTTLFRSRGFPEYGQAHANLDVAVRARAVRARHPTRRRLGRGVDTILLVDRKSTRLNSSHANISYAVFCLKKKHTTYLARTYSARAHV